MCADGKQSLRPVRSEKELREDARKLWKEKNEDGKKKVDGV